MSIEAFSLRQNNVYSLGLDNWFPYTQTSASRLAIVAMKKRCMMLPNCSTTMCPTLVVWLPLWSTLVNTKQLLMGLGKQTALVHGRRWVFLSCNFNTLRCVLATSLDDLEKELANFLEKDQAHLWLANRMYVLGITVMAYMVNIQMLLVWLLLYTDCWIMHILVVSSKVIYVQVAISWTWVLFNLENSGRERDSLNLMCLAFVGGLNIEIGWGKGVLLYFPGKARKAFNLLNCFRFALHVLMEKSSDWPRCVAFTLWFMQTN